MPSAAEPVAFGQARWGRRGLAEYGGWLFPGGNPAKVKPAYPPPIT